MTTEERLESLKEDLIEQIDEMLRVKEGYNDERALVLAKILACLPPARPTFQYVGNLGRNKTHYQA